MRGLLLAVLAMCVACDKQSGTQETLAQVVHRLDNNHYLGDAVDEGNLTVWPVFSNRPAEVGDFLTLADAQKRGLAEVREQESANVSTLMIENKATVPILVCAGALVKGGQQDRQIGQDFVIQAKTTVPVEAFCVEKSRWQGEKGFDALNAVATAKVRKAAQYEKNQGKVWEKVAEARDAVRITMSEGTYLRGTSVCDVLNVDVNARKKRAGKIREHFAAQVKRPVGFAYAINGKPVSVRTFAHTQLFSGQFDGFLEAMCLEALLAPDKARGAKPNDIVNMVRAISKAAEEVVETAAANRNGYRRGKTGFNGSCYMEINGRRVLITQDWSKRE